MPSVGNAGYRSVLGPVDDSIVDAQSPEALASQIERTINDDKFRTELYERQQERVLEFDVNTVGQKILDVYKACQKRATDQ